MPHVTAVSILLRSLKYSDETIKRYQRCYLKLSDFMESNHLVNSEINRELFEKFFQDKFSCPFYLNYSPSKLPFYKTISRYHRAFSVLADVITTGRISRRINAKDHTIPSCYQPASDEFLSICEPFARTTKRQMRQRLEYFTGYLQKRGITDFSKITKSDILKYWDIRGYVCRKTRQFDSYFLRKFFTFLYKNHYTIIDNSVFVPFCVEVRRNIIPSHYTIDELNKLLASIDRCSPIGKRDYAIILFAIRYGVRVEDIRNLELSDFDWSRNTVSFIQDKTDKNITFNLYNDVIEAFYDYFKNGRPETECKKVFVRHVPPYEAFGPDNNLHHIICKYMRIAGFTDFHSRKIGLNGMRHSIAGNLLDEGTPLPVVTEILNHSDTETTMHYIKIATKQLRECALEVDY